MSYIYNAFVLRFISIALFYILITAFLQTVYFGLPKTFDRVKHVLLLHKLPALNIDPGVLGWIESFVFSRSQFVVANDFTSDLAPVESAVPQGSVLGPLLFLIYIIDIPDNISSKICLFADDCVIYRKITGASDVATLQSDLNNIYKWWLTWCMELNINQCKSMRISRSNTICPAFALNTCPLQSVSTYRYLGIHITNDLSWKHHIQYITLKCNRSLRYLKRNFSFAPVQLKRLLYISYVSPKLEYASSIWDPHQFTLFNEIESVQNRAVRFFLSNYHRSVSVSLLKSTLHIPLLSIRRKNLRISLFHKIYHHNPFLRSLWIHPALYHSARHDQAYKVSIPHHNTLACSQSFLPKTSIDWNNLPASLVSITEPTRFKNALINSES